MTALIQRKWFLPAVLYALGGTYLLFGGQTRLPSGPTATVENFRQLHVEGHLSLADKSVQSSLRFYVHLAEVPLDLYFRGPQIHWSGDGHFVLEQQLKLSQSPKHLALEVDGPECGARKLSNLAFQSQPDESILHCSLPELVLTVGAPAKPAIRPSRPELPQSVYVNAPEADVPPQVHPPGDGRR
ncbi:hypothetical protein IV102_30005 [bacterium]|nr:hypothetical protein [bacterium]